METELTRIRTNIKQLRERNEELKKEVLELRRQVAGIFVDVTEHCGRETTDVMTEIDQITIEVIH